ncbi:BTAD domain-containing putative transcriptional regulator [Umezawaea sp. NPDC059074]|uniref:AfsR/SARP family transcriptional regulator n=1 Tax=Umezawaea sp. NPDC059074 TaxID=3346716 RepID=UPI0036A8889D
MTVEFAVLGPLEVRLDGVPVPLPSGRSRVLLATLLLRANVVVSIDELVDRLWDGSPPTPARAKSTLHMVVSRLRQALGDADCVRTSAEGYFASVAPGTLDLHRFRALVDEKRFADALALWRGPVLANVASDSLHRDEVAPLVDERLEVLERRIDADVEAGALTGLVAELRVLTRQHPLRERFWAQLMLVLYRSEQQAEALAAYRAVSGVLGEELGIDPGPALRDLHDRVLRSDPDLAGPRPTAAPRQLPSGTTHFVGRSQELDLLGGLLDSAEAAGGSVIVSAVNGTGGVGKTTLALHWANRMKDRFPDGQLYVNLRGFDPRREPLAAADALRGFLGAFIADPKGIPDDGDAQVSLYRSLLSTKRVLVVLDNARDAEQVRPLLPGSPTCFTVITSRNRLEGLVVTDDASLLALDVLDDAESLALLGRRIGTAALTAEPQAVERIVALCGGLPLALAIVAARVVANPRSSLATIADELSSEQGRLDVLDTGDLATSVRGVFSWSYKHLSEPTARVFRVLALHPGAHFAVPAVASAAAIPIEAAREALLELVRTNLLLSLGSDRFQYHDLLRMYAAELSNEVEDAAERRLVQKRLFSHYLYSANAAKIMELDWFTPHEPILDGVVVVVGVGSQAEAMEWYEAEHNTLASLLRLAISGRFSEYVDVLQNALWLFMDMTSRWEQTVALSELVLEYFEEVEDPYEFAPRMKIDLAASHGRRGRFEKSIEYSRAVLDAGHERGELHLQRKALNNMAMAYTELGRHQEAVEFAEAALEVSSRDRGGMGRRLVLNTLAIIYGRLGEHDKAEGCLREALELNRLRDDTHTVSQNLVVLGETYCELRKWDQAREVLVEALELSRANGSRYNEATSLSLLGDVREAGGDEAGAEVYRKQALDVFTELDMPEAHALRARLVAAAGEA